MQFPFLTEATPTEISDEINSFCERVSPGQIPAYTAVRPVASCEVAKCHRNVANHVRAEGGEPVFGWIIWQSTIFLHAEFHCNWRNQLGEVIDITPKSDGEKAILFLPDPTRRWEGRVIPSQRVARIDRPLVHRLVDVYDQIGRLQAKYRPDERGTEQDNRAYAALNGEAAMLALQIGRDLAERGEYEPSPEERLATTILGGMRIERVQPHQLGASKPKTGRNSPCPCGSGRKFKKCCLRT